MSDMAAKMAEIRRAAAARYKTVPEEAKPHIRLCETCGLSVYSSKVCGVSGVMHDVDKYKFVGGMAIKEGTSHIIKGEAFVEAINATRIKWEPARVQICKVDGDSINLFQSFAMRLQWRLMRYGILYGKVNHSDTATSNGGIIPSVEVHTIFEPEQIGHEDYFTPVEHGKDPNVANADRIAELLGLRRVGLVCTHQARDADEMVLSAKELMMLAREQSIYGDHCCLITLSPNLETNQINAQAWQASRQCVHLFQLGMLSAPVSGSEKKALMEKAEANPVHSGGRTLGGSSSGRAEASSSSSASPSLAKSSSSKNAEHNGADNDEDEEEGLEEAMVYSTHKLEVAQEDDSGPRGGSGSGHKRVIIKEPSSKVDARWMTGFVAIEAFSSPVIGSTFIRLGRPQEEPPTLNNVHTFLSDPKRNRLPFCQQIADFHVLMFLASTIFDIKHDIPSVIQGIVTKQNALLENYESLLKEYIRSVRGD